MVGILYSAAPLTHYSNTRFFIAAAGGIKFTRDSQRKGSPACIAPNPPTNCLVRPITAALLAATACAVVLGGPAVAVELTGAQQQADSETLSNIPQTLSSECEGGDCAKKDRIQRPKSKQAETCTVKCVNTCIRGGYGSPGEVESSESSPVEFSESSLVESSESSLVEFSESCLVESSESSLVESSESSLVESSESSLVESSESSSIGTGSSFLIGEPYRLCTIKSSIGSISSSEKSLQTSGLKFLSKASANVLFRLYFEAPSQIHTLASLLPHPEGSTLSNHYKSYHIARILNAVLFFKPGRTVLPVPLQWKVRLVKLPNIPHCISKSLPQ
nr:uncharacterized protein LOC109192340 isoform X2 [Ipomoea batatas]